MVCRLLRRLGRASDGERRWLLGGCMLRPACVHPFLHCVRNGSLGSSRVYGFHPWAGKYKYAHASVTYTLRVDTFDMKLMIALLRGLGGAFGCIVSCFLHYSKLACFFFAPSLYILFVYGNQRQHSQPLFFDLLACCFACDHGATAG